MRIALALGAVATLALSTIGCGDGGEPPVTVVIGDSITVISQEQIEARLADDYKLAIKADEGWTLADQIPAAEALSEFDPEIVVVNLGTNDVAQDNANPVADMEKILAIYRGQTCRVVTVTSLLLQPERVKLADKLNDYIRGVENWVVADWDQLVKDYTEDGEPDGPLPWTPSTPPTWARRNWPT